MKLLQINHINKVRNPNTHYDFPVLFPNTEYFESIQNVLNSYGIILDLLSKKNYVLKDFIDDMINNPMLNSISKELEFEVIKKESDGVKNSERIVNLENEVVFELYYTNDVYQIYDKSEDTTYDVSLYIDFDILQLYFTGSYIYAIDKINTKKYFIYLD